MDFFETVKKRRSIRRFTKNPVNPNAIQKALECALLAPNSSNAQTWDFYWVQSEDNKKKLVKFCLSQSAARTAAELIVVVASPSSWTRSQPKLVEYVESIKAPEAVIKYYKVLFPLMYRWGFFNIIGIFKWVTTALVGLFRPMPRSGSTLQSIQEVCIKSAALAAENFVLAITAQGYSTCMMEGFDECRVKKLLKLSRTDRVVMVIAVGEEEAQGTWGPQYRLSSELFIHRV